MTINDELKESIESEILIQYIQNDPGHGIEHIRDVIKRSFYFANNLNNLNLDMVYTIAAYHDIGHSKDADNHEKISSDMLLADSKLKNFFNQEEMNMMSEAIYDHRASLTEEPRNIYGKIISSADRNVSVETVLKRTYAYKIKHNKDYFLSDIIEESRQHLIKKYGKNGYATTKMYFEDSEYKKFIKEIIKLTNNKNTFIKKYLEVNNIKDDIYITIFEKLCKQKPELSIEELLYETFLRTRVKNIEKFEKYKQKIITANKSIIKTIDYKNKLT